MNRSLDVHLIRHGESAANAGQVSSDPASIPLTELGRTQAQRLADTMPFVPDRIIVSPFLRARQTAAPAIARFPEVPVEEWPIHEFTYLCPERCRNTTCAERSGWVKTYWDATDPDYVDGPGAESFAAFLGRVQQAVGRLTDLSNLDTTQVALFGHGQFIQAMCWVMRFQATHISRESMMDFRQVDRESPIGNVVKTLACYDGRKWAVSRPPTLQDPA